MSDNLREMIAHIRDYDAVIQKDIHTAAALVKIAVVLDAIVARLPPEPKKKREAGWYWVKENFAGEWYHRPMHTKDGTVFVSDPRAARASWYYESSSFVVLSRISEPSR